jgi:hypothetical protein
VRRAPFGADAETLFQMTDRPAPRRSRLATVVLLLATVVAGLASRRYPGWQPDFVARYAGDTLWAAMVFWGLALLWPARRAPVLGGWALGIAFADEFSQLYRAPWIDGARATRLGALALGQGFLWSDLWCYAAGVALATGIDWALARVCRNGPRSSPFLE